MTIYKTMFLGDEKRENGLKRVGLNNNLFLGEAESKIIFHSQNIFFITGNTTLEHIFALFLTHSRYRCRKLNTLDCVKYTVQTGKLKEGVHQR